MKVWNTKAFSAISPERLIRRHWVRRRSNLLNMRRLSGYHTTGSSKLSAVSMQHKHANARQGEVFLYHGTQKWGQHHRRGEYDLEEKTFESLPGGVLLKPTPKWAVHGNSTPPVRLFDLLLDCSSKPIAKRYRVTKFPSVSLIDRSLPPFPICFLLNSIGLLLLVGCCNTQPRSECIHVAETELIEMFLWVWSCRSVGIWFAWGPIWHSPLLFSSLDFTTHSRSLEDHTISSFSGINI
jgi:hypothetical protein